MSGTWSRILGRLDAMIDGVIEWDHRMVRRISGIAFLKKFNRLFLSATYLGDGYLWGGLGLGLILFGRSIDRYYVLIGLGVTIVNVGVFRIIKVLVGRVRPTESLPRLRSRVIDGYSFPSGHATTSFGLAWVVSQSYPILGIQAAIYAVAATIAFSRVYVREHYPIDVVFGAGLGTLVAALLFPLFRWAFL